MPFSAIAECVKQFGEQCNSDGETLRAVHSLVERGMLVQANIKLDVLVRGILTQNSLTPHAVDWPIFSNPKFPTSDEELVKVNMWLKLHFPSIFPSPAVSGASFAKGSKKGNTYFCDLRILLIFLIFRKGQKTCQRPTSLGLFFFRVDPHGTTKVQRCQGYSCCLARCH